MTTGSKNKLRQTGLAVLVLVFSLAFAAPALAQSDPTSAQYDDAVSQAGGGSVKPGIPGTKSDSSGGKDGALEQNLVGDLPITGLDVLALAAVAAALTAMGFALRVMTTPADDAG